MEGLVKIKNEHFFPWSIENSDVNTQLKTPTISDYNSPENIISGCGPKPLLHMATTDSNGCFGLSESTRDTTLNFNRAVMSMSSHEQYAQADAT